MKTMKYIYWREGRLWLGHLQEFPDYMTQGRTLTELKANLKDIYDDLTGGKIPGVRRVGELQVA